MNFLNFYSNKNSFVVSKEQLIEVNQILLQQVEQLT